MHNQDETLRLIEDVIKIAELAGREIMDIYENSTPKALKTKSDQSPLTKADVASHKSISKGLRKLLPKIPIVSEEDLESINLGQSCQFFWLIDPLDGTKEFLARNGEFTVNIALISNQYPLFGVVVCPSSNETYWGGQNFGAFKKISSSIKPIKVSESFAAQQLCRAIVSRNHANEDTQNFLSKIGDYVCIEAGSSLKFCKIADGSADLYPRLAPTSEWDTAAAQSILEGAGGYVFNLSGDRLVYGKSNILNPYFIASSISYDLLNQKINS